VQRDARAVQRDAKPVQRDAKPVQHGAKPVQRDATLVQHDARPVQRGASRVQRGANAVWLIEGRYGYSLHERLVTRGTPGGITHPECARRGNAGAAQPQRLGYREWSGAIRRSPGQAQRGPLAIANFASRDYLRHSWLELDQIDSSA
jgi:hypothetical protein